MWIFIILVIIHGEEGFICQKRCLFTFRNGNDGRYIYKVTGQYGPQCRGPTACNFVLDTEDKVLQDLPPLHVPRYAVDC
ncbi:kelch repeat-containing protein-like [Iris pallida]|uniref:Kelch repeat-containing protein-like n=1 Tax=Iris pallida TaxID=29817 RepID=A0AAX6H8C6_IRIPA|nr:kelch repeat-containing protein-like [Iris pallida]KAJ6836635.1 kelch repeat-containing protein-like [Iris pallida]